MLALMGLSAVGATIAPQKQVLVTYPNDTPQSELDEFRSAIESTGSEIVHEYNLIKGFVVKASTEALETIHTLSQQYVPIIEDDATVTIQN
ncbi:MAG: hypothetical protein OHK93_007166 [Ramalina farinacea]|uniref:Inhibitor I9 domain-containing protein n=1 Tax=Ramalina farinacea TaxID=258253 RepID=A0AA43TTS5_9LECA|nr:hypothetical protein [Ramalina farinacea]